MVVMVAAVIRSSDRVAMVTVAPVAESMSILCQIRNTSHIPFNKRMMWWLGVWLNSQLTLIAQHAARLKLGHKAMIRFWYLTGQMGWSPANCRKVLTAYVQSVTMFMSELWWKGDHVWEMIG